MDDNTSEDMCPGCGGLYPVNDGPTHPYIGANAGCWSLYSSLLAATEPDSELLAASRAPWSVATETSTISNELSRELLVDAYAAQHHGTPSPQAIQSVAVHLMALHGVFRRGVKKEGVLWARRRALRTRGVFEWLTPPPLYRALSIRHMYAANGDEGLVVLTDYVRSVYESWSSCHEKTISQWYERFVVKD